MILIAPKGHFLGQIPHPRINFYTFLETCTDAVDISEDKVRTYQRVSEMNAILLVGVTSIQSFPVRTTGPTQVRIWMLCVHTRLLALLTTFLRVLEWIPFRDYYLWFAFVRIDNGYSVHSQYMNDRVSGDIPCVLVGHCR